MNAGNLSVALQYKQKEPPIDKSQPLWKKKILCQKCLADKPEPSCAYAHSNVEAAAAATAATAPAEAATAPAEAATAPTAPIDKSNSSWRKQIICQKCPPNQPPKASCGYSHSCTEFEAAWSLANQKQADEEKAQKEKEEKAQEEKAQKEKEEKAQKVKEAKAQKAKEAKEKKEQEEKEAKEKKEQEEKEAKEKKEQEEKAQKEKEEKAQKAKEARAQKAKEAKEAKEQEEKAAAATWAALQEQKEKEEKEEKAQKAKEARAQKAKAQKEAPPPPYEPQPPSPPPIVEDDNVSTTSTSSSTSSKKKPAKEKIPSAVKRIVWNTYIGKDNLKGTCLCCNSEEVTVTNFECGHVKSEKNGGEVTVYNLRPICSNCNKSVGANDMDDFMKRYGISTPKNWNGLGSACAATATAAPKSKKDK